MFNGRYISLKEVIYRLKRHPLLSHVEIGDIAYDAMDIINLVGTPLIYESKVKFLDIEEFRTALPCDFLYIISAGKIVNEMVSPLSTGTSTRAGNEPCINANGFNTLEIGTYSIKRGYMYFEFETGTVEVNYKAVALDEDGYPMIPDNVSLIKAIEEHVKVQHFRMMVDMQEMPEGPLRRAETEYAWYIGQAQGTLLMPDLDEMESIKNSLIRIVHETSEHDNGFRNSARDVLNESIGHVDVPTGGTGGSSEPEKDLLIQFTFGLAEVELAPITIIEEQVGLYDTLQVDPGSVGGVLNINGVDTPVPFSLAIGDIVIAKRTNGAATGWLTVSFNG